MGQRVGATGRSGWALLGAGLALACAFQARAANDLVNHDTAHHDATPASGALITLETRPGVESSYWWMPRSNARATLLLLAGGHGGMGLREGVPQSQNFLIRSRETFASAGFHVALMGNPSDHRALTPEFRASAEHAQDLRATLQDLARRSALPVWLVGTSQGTISAAAGALALGPQAVAGVVLSSSISMPQPGGSVPDLALERITVPVLVYQHAQDACRITPASGARRLLPRLTQSPRTHYWEVTGGGPPHNFGSEACGAQHYHGFLGMEAQAVADITGWIAAPAAPPPRP